MFFKFHFAGHFGHFREAIDHQCQWISLAFSAPLLENVHPQGAGKTCCAFRKLFPSNLRSATNKGRENLRDGKNLGISIDTEYGRFTNVTPRGFETVPETL